MRADGDPLSRPCAAFDGARLIAAGAIAEVALAVRGVLDRTPEASILVFDDRTGGVVDLDLRGGPQRATQRNPCAFGKDSDCEPGPQGPTSEKAGAPWYL